MNKQFLRFTFFLLICLTLPLGATAQVVSIPDPNLRTVIEGRLGKASREPITTSDMAALTQLYAVNSNIIRLTRTGTCNQPDISESFVQLDSGHLIVVEVNQPDTVVSSW